VLTCKKIRHLYLYIWLAFYGWCVYRKNQLEIIYVFAPVALSQENHFLKA